MRELQTLTSTPLPHEDGGLPRCGDFSVWMERGLVQIETALERFVAPGAPVDLAEAMRYAVLSGGKRLRGLLVLGALQAVSGGVRHDGESEAVWHDCALRAACAVELIHTYSLVHDDMPCMDNDVLRRGKATVHVKFGEAGALLAGDAMQALAFDILLPPPQPGLTGALAQQLLTAQVVLCRLLAQAAGPGGMAGGQAIDLANVGKSMDLPALQQMHELKTGALLHASVMMGAGCSPCVPPHVLEALSVFGRTIGLAFQVVDDVLDITGDSATLGKTAGKDEAAHKPTYVSAMGIEAARDYAQLLHRQALQALEGSGLQQEAVAALRGLAGFVIERSH